MAANATLLPPNASRLERALEAAAGARLAAVPVAIETLWNPATIAPELLPWLGWGLSIDRWESDWSESQKRAAVADAIAAQRRKGTPASIDAVLADFDELLRLVEWFETTPRGRPHTFEVRLPLDGTGGRRAGAAFADAIVREVSRVKPARSHFELVQMLAAAGAVGVVAAGQATGFTRRDATASGDTTQPWAALLTTELGEPLEAPDGAYLET